MAEFQKSLVVNCTPEQAFAIVSDVARHPEWATTKLEVEKTSEGEIAVGTTFRTTGYQFGKHEGEVRIVELIPREGGLRIERRCGAQPPLLPPGTNRRRDDGHEIAAGPRI